MTEEKQASLFDFINQVTSKSRKFKYDKKIAPAFMLTSWISHNRDFTKICNEINKIQGLLPDERVYEYYMKRLPAGKKYIKWVKKDKADEKIKTRIEKLQNFFPQLSKRECEMILSSLLRKKGD